MGDVSFQNLFRFQQRLDGILFESFYVLRSTEEYTSSLEVGTTSSNVTLDMAALTLLRAYFRSSEYMDAMGTHLIYNVPPNYIRELNFDFEQIAKSGLKPICALTYDGVKDFSPTHGLNCNSEQLRYIYNLMKEKYDAICDLVINHEA